MQFLLTIGSFLFTVEFLSLCLGVFSHNSSDLFYSHFNLFFVFTKGKIVCPNNSTDRKQRN